MDKENLLVKGLSELGLTITEEQIEKFDKYYEMLIETNKVMNLTSITEYDEVIIKHFIDSLLVVNIFDISKSKKMIDVGTGAGFLADAAMAVVVMADPLASDVWIEDAAIASIMIQLQAEDLGLGSCWIQVRERFTATGMPSGEYVHTLLDIPLQLQVVSIIAVGHKGMERKPFNEDHLQWEKIHINKFGGK